jgi:hypothetical protein
MFVGVRMTTMFCGTGNACGWRSESAATMKSCQIGPAPSIPMVFTIGVWLLLPTQTAVTRSGV